MSVGTLLGGRYELLASLGRGGFGTVWRAHDRTLGRDVAIKLITLDSDRPELHAEVAARFEREARAVAALNHPNIVTAHDYGVEGETAYLVMELIRGGSLADELAARASEHGGPLPIDRVIGIATQICAGLAAAHAAGVIHRDLKPANIMVAAGGPVKIVDFGIARVADKSRITHTGTYVGTLRYTSPEQMTADPVDARSDLYSLGCLLFEVLTGRSPYQAETSLQWMAAHQYATPTKLRTYVPSAPIGLEALIDQMLAKRPADRPASALEVRGRLEQLWSPAPPPRPPAGPPAGPVSVPSMPAPTPYGPPLASPQWSPTPPPTRPAYPGYPIPGSVWPVGYPPYGPPAPPRTVLTAAWLLRSTAGLTVVLLFGVLVAYHRIAANWDVAFTPVIRSSDMPVVGLVLVILGGGVQIACSLALATQLQRGNPVGRVFAWIFVVANLLCCFGTFASSDAFTPTTGDYSTSNQALITSAGARFSDAYPLWLTVLSATVGVLGMLALIAAATMMLRRPSLSYFQAMGALRRRR